MSQARLSNYLYDYFFVHVRENNRSFHSCKGNSSFRVITCYFLSPTGLPECQRMKSLTSNTPFHPGKDTRQRSVLGPYTHFC